MFPIAGDDRSADRLHGTRRPQRDEPTRRRRMDRTRPQRRGRARFTAHGLLAVCPSRREIRNSGFRISRGDTRNPVFRISRRDIRNRRARHPERESKTSGTQGSGELYELSRNSFERSARESNRAPRRRGRDCAGPTRRRLPTGAASIRWRDAHTLMPRTDRSDVMRDLVNRSRRGIQSEAK
jgi:hypothetical protein